MADMILRFLSSYLASVFAANVRFLDKLDTRNNLLDRCEL